MASTPKKYEQFLAQKVFEKYAGFAIKGLPTWGDSQTEVAFLKELDFDLLDENEIDREAHPSVVPIARVGKDVGAAAFLAIDGAKTECPVLLWDEGEFHPVAPSLDAFLKKLRKKSERKSASYYDGVWRAVNTAIEEKNYKGALAVLEDPVKVGQPNAKERSDLAEALCNLFNSSGQARSSLPGNDPTPDFETAIAWAKAGKVTPRYPYLNLIDWYAYSTHNFENAIARAEELLGLEPGEEEVEFYCGKAIGLSALGLGDDAKAEDAYRQVHQRFGEDAAKKKEILGDLTKSAAKLKSQSLAKTIAGRFKSGRWNG